MQQLLLTIIVLSASMYLLGVAGEDPADQAPSCAATSCPEDTYCELQQVQCFRAPCYPIPTCKELTNTCKNVKCSAGYTCAMQQVQCFAAPCPPLPQCVPVPTEAQL